MYRLHITLPAEGLVVSITVPSREIVNTMCQYLGAGVMGKDIQLFAQKLDIILNRYVGFNTPAFYNNSLRIPSFEQKLIYKISLEELELFLAFNSASDVEIMKLCLYSSEYILKNGMFVNKDLFSFTAIKE